VKQNKFSHPFMREKLVNDQYVAGRQNKLKGRSFPLPAQCDTKETLGLKNIYYLYAGEVGE